MGRINEITYVHAESSLVHGMLNNYVLDYWSVNNYF